MLGIFPAPGRPDTLPVQAGVNPDPGARCGLRRRASDRPEWRRLAAVVVVGRVRATRVNKQLPLPYRFLFPEMKTAAVR